MSARVLAVPGAGLLGVVVIFVAVLMVIPGGSFLGAVSAAPATASGTLPTAGAAPAPGGNSAAAGSYNWPELHGDPLLDGVTKNTTLSTANAAQLGVEWAAELYGQAIDSPVIAYNPALKESLVYVGTEDGFIEAVNLANGQIVWTNWLGSPMASSPVYANGSLYVGTQRNSALFQLNATTGSDVCSMPIPYTVQGTPVVATPPGGVLSAYIGSEGGPTYAMNAGTCAVEWKFTDFTLPVGTWDPYSYVVAQNGTPLVVIGSANPDSTIYAIDAVTGKLEWKYRTVFPAGGNWDLGAGVTISAPGVNGFSSGVAYAINKYCSLVGVSLTNGAPIWGENIDNLTGSIPECRSTPALAGTQLVFGHNGGIIDVNAKNGSVRWVYADASGTEIISSPAIVGRTVATSIVVAGDLGGSIDVLSLETGQLLYSYQTGNYITASPAISDGNIVIASTDSLLYDLAVGGGNDAQLPTTSISSPSFDARVANPTPALLTIHGNATDPRGVASVGVGIETDALGGPWWDGTSGTWTTGPYTNLATLASPGATSTAWTYSIAVPAGGQALDVQANAVSVSGQTDFLGASVSFAVNASTTAPHLKANPSTVGPGVTTTVNGGAFGRGELVTIRYLNLTLATEHATSTGYLPNIKVTIPTTAGFGLSGITATGSSTGKVATAAVEILNNWDALGYNATHTGNEPNDPTFYNEIDVGTGNFVHLAWNFVAGGAINATPVIASDIAYVANTEGLVYAISVHLGGTYWIWNGSGGSAIVGEAINPSYGLLYATAANGQLYAISISNGTTAWSVNIGGTPTAPEFSTNGVYVASSPTSSTGRVEDLNGQTGAVKWTDNFASKITAAPTITYSGKLLVIGDWGGQMLALNSSNGHSEWTYTVSGAIRAAATVWNDSVYFGSDNHYVYDLTYNGVLVWDYKTAAAVEDTGVLTFTQASQGVPLLAIGANNGELYALRSTNGKLTFNESAAGAIVGVAVVQGMIVANHAGGVVTSVRNYADYGIFGLNLKAPLATTPIILNGALFIASGSGVLYAYTPTGEPPA
ncbi:MAG TPA: PQQ-binding-like beta-propeller repeat protein [Thermoplasmata archaeon]|nr:PQQ-binding-like beta-propeller repeat protein [Thermoplasmata archaeon]